MAGTEWTQTIIPKVLCHWLSYTLNEAILVPLLSRDLWGKKVNMGKMWVKKSLSSLGIHPCSWCSCWTLVISGYMALFLWCGLSSEKGLYHVCWQLGLRPTFSVHRPRLQVPEAIEESQCRGMGSCPLEPDACFLFSNFTLSFVLGVKSIIEAFY